MRRNRLTARLAAALTAATPAMAVAIAGAGVAVHTSVAPAGTARIEPVLQTFDLTEPPGIRLVATGRAAQPRTAELTKRATAPFSLVGVTWTDPRTGPQGAIEVRRARLQRPALGRAVRRGTGSDHRARWRPAGRAPGRPHQSRRTGVRAFLQDGRGRAAAGAQGRSGRAGRPTGPAGAQADDQGRVGRRRVDRGGAARVHRRRPRRLRAPHRERQRLRLQRVGEHRARDRTVPRQEQGLERHRLQLPGRPVRADLRGARGRGAPVRSRRAHARLQRERQRRRGDRRLPVRRDPGRGSRLGGTACRVQAGGLEQSAARQGRPGLGRQRPVPGRADRGPQPDLRAPRHRPHRMPCATAGSTVPPSTTGSTTPAARPDRRGTSTPRPG
jgi:hypothetical protein